MNKTVFIIIIIILCFFVYKRDKAAMEIRNSTNYFTNSKDMPEPVQKRKFPPKIIPLNVRYGTYNMKCVADYDIIGRVVAKGNYADNSVLGTIIPYDIAIAWGKAGEASYGQYSSYTHSGRKIYSYYNEKCPFSKDYANSHISNNRIISKDASIMNEIRYIRVGNVVRLKGCLVNVTGKNDQEILKTSTRRWDVGPDADEVIYVDNVKIYR